jgi:hypothetical protein
MSATAFESALSTRPLARTWAWRGVEKTERTERTERTEKSTEGTARNRPEAAAKPAWHFPVLFNRSVLSVFSVFSVFFVL